MDEDVLSVWVSKRRELAQRAGMSQEEFDKWVGRARNSPSIRPDTVMEAQEQIDGGLALDLGKLDKALDLFLAGKTERRSKAGQRPKVK